MKKEDIVSGHVYKNKKSGHLCVVFKGYDYGCIANSIEIAMIYQGSDKKPDNAPPFVGTSFGNLEPYELKPEDILTEEHVKKVCKSGSGKTCAYLTMSPPAGFVCAKVLGNQSIANTIDDRLREGTMNAKGNNCGGRYNPKEL